MNHTPHLFCDIQKPIWAWGFYREYRTPTSTPVAALLSVTSMECRGFLSCLRGFKMNHNLSNPSRIDRHCRVLLKLDTRIWGLEKPS